jgi:hypothetical protein
MLRARQNLQTLQQAMQQLRQMGNTPEVRRLMQQLQQRIEQAMRETNARG